MKFKLIIALLPNELTSKAIDIARSHGATGSTVITSASGEGLEPTKTFLGLSMVGQRDIILFIVEEHHSREILEAIGTTCSFDEKPGSGVAFQLDIEDAVGLLSQVESIEKDIRQEEL